MRVKLPNGIVDGQDHFNYATVNELTGKQQNYLVDKDLVVGNLGHIPKIVNDLVSLETEEGLVWKGEKKDLCWKLTVTDIETILIKIREETFGPEFYHEAECEFCKHNHKNMKLALDKLEIKYISLEDMLDKKKKTIVLPKSGKEVILKPMYLKDTFEIIKISKNKTDKLITNITTLTIRKLGEKSPISEKDLEKLSARDITFLIKTVESLKADNKELELKLEGFIDTDIEFDCANCNKENKIQLNAFDPDFFDHSKATST